MPSRLGSVEALVHPDRRQIFVTGTDDYDFDDPDYDKGRFVHPAKEILYVISSSEWPHQALVRLEAWDGEPTPGGEWDDVDLTRVWFSDSAIIVQALYETALSDELTLGEPGWYSARVHTRGRAALAQAIADRVDGDNDSPPGVEEFLLQFWPAAP